MKRTRYVSAAAAVTLIVGGPATAAAAVSADAARTATAAPALRADVTAEGAAAAALKHYPGVVESLDKDGSVWHVDVISKDGLLARRGQGQGREDLGRPGGPHHRQGHPVRFRLRLGRRRRRRQLRRRPAPGARQPGTGASGRSARRTGPPRRTAERPGPADDVQDSAAGTGHLPTACVAQRGVRTPSAAAGRRRAAAAPSLRPRRSRGLTPP
ncbi:hypothetical protein [Streptomyces yangpuensis]|uniref:hypothetical protein n=1 Tax=Streptomyces yangpuensis TaxID=1648182 RepID=UPI0037FC2597